MLLFDFFLCAFKHLSGVAPDTLSHLQWNTLKYKLIVGSVIATLTKISILDATGLLELHFFSIFRQHIIIFSESLTRLGVGRNRIFFGGRFFYQVVGTYGVILIIQTFFKAKNNILLILNID